MKTELLAEKTALVMQNKNGGFRDLYGSLSTVQCCRRRQSGSNLGVGDSNHYEDAGMVLDMLDASYNSKLGTSTRCYGQPSIV